jgi:hypothetical protein
MAALSFTPSWRPVSDQFGGNGPCNPMFTLDGFAILWPFNTHQHRSNVVHSADVNKPKGVLKKDFVSAYFKDGHLL